MGQKESLRDAVYRLCHKKLKEGFELEAIHTYKSQTGDPLYYRIRLEHPLHGKYIRPMSLCDGVYQLQEPSFDKEKPLYNQHLINFSENETIYVVEGEKCADTLVKIGLPAVTSGGATSAVDTDWKNLAGVNVVIWPDNDESGERYASEVSHQLNNLAKSVSFIDVNELGLLRKGDCVDWIRLFQEAHERLPTKDEIENLKKQPSSISSDLKEPKQPFVSLQCAAEITPEPISWIWDGWLARGKLHILAGQAGTGKTTLAMSLAATITRGGLLPDKSQSPLGSVLIWSGEDSPSDTLTPRLMAVGADLNRVHFVNSTTLADGNRPFDPANDMPLLMQAADSIEDLALLIVDPIVNAVTGDSHKNGEVRRGLQPIVDFADHLKCAVVGITHFSKGGQGKDPLERVTGSLAFGALARVVIATAKINSKETPRRIFCRAKSNIGADGNGFEYEILEKEITTGLCSSFACWGDAVEGSAKDLLSEPDQRLSGVSGQSALDEAKEFLQEILKDGPLSQREIQIRADEEGVKWRTLSRAKKLLNIKSRNNGSNRQWFWEMASVNIKGCQERQDQNLASLASFDKQCDGINHDVLEI